MTQWATTYVFEILIRSLDNASFPYWINFLNNVSVELHGGFAIEPFYALKYSPQKKKSFAQNKQAREWFMNKVADDVGWRDTVFFECPHGRMLFLFSSLLC